MGLNELLRSQGLWMALHANSEGKCCKAQMTLAGLEPAIFGSKDQRLIH